MISGLGERTSDETQRGEVPNFPDYKKAEFDGILHRCTFLTLHVNRRSRRSQG